MGGMGIWLEAARPKTLPAAVAPVLLGSAAAGSAGAFDVRAAGLCLGFALLMQIGTNYANDYLDGVRGTDTAARVGPRRAVAGGLVEPASMRRAAVGVLAAGFCLGLGLIPFGGWGLLGVGVAGVVCAWLYTGGPYPLAYHGLGDVFVLLFFGFVAVCCTYYVQAGAIPGPVWALGLGCGLLVNNILVVNNHRDAEEDAAAGKRTLVVRFGRGWARAQYAASAALAGGVALWHAAVVSGWPALAALVPAAAGLWLARRLGRARGAADYDRLLQGSALAAGGYALFFSIGILLA